MFEQIKHPLFLPGPIIPLTSDYILIEKNKFNKISKCNLHPSLTPQHYTMDLLSSFMLLLSTSKWTDLKVQQCVPDCSFSFRKFSFISMENTGMIKDLPQLNQQIQNEVVTEVTVCLNV